MRHLPFLKSSIALVALVTIFPSMPSAAGVAKAPAALPKKHIESVYRNGDIDSVIFYLKQGRDKPLFMDKSDSILAFKYLGTIFAADKDKREKGRYYFNQMLRLDPGASITELLPGESARTVFREAREEFFELNPALVPRTDGVPVTVRTSPATSEDESSDSDMPPSTPLPTPGPAIRSSKPISPIWWWVAGGAVAIGAAAVTVAVIEPEPKTRPLHD